MHHSLRLTSIIGLVVLLGTNPVAGQNQIDQASPGNNTLMANFSQPNLAQSFTPSLNSCSGAGIFLSTGGVGGVVTINLWDALPNVAGANMLATGTVMALPNTVADAFWPAVPVVPLQVYFIEFTSTDLTLGIRGDTTNPYPGGQTYANQGFGSFPTFDYTFRTFAPAPPSFTMSVTSDGVGGGGIAINGIPTGTAEGWTFISANTSTPVGMGPIFGITPDALTYSIPTAFPFATVGNPLHWLTLLPGVFPNAPFAIPPGTLTSFAGQSWDFVAIGLDAGLIFTGQSTVDRVTW